MTSGQPFDDIRNLLKGLSGPDEGAVASTRARDAALSSSGFETGRAGELAEWLAAWSGHSPARLGRGVVALFVGTHGVAGQGVSARPDGFERRFVEHVAAGGAPVNQLCGAGELGLKIFDLALDLPVSDITEDAALDEKSCAATIAFGMEAIAGGADLLCLGGVGAGSEVAAAVIMTSLVGGAPADWLPEVEEGLKRRQAAVADKALVLHTSALADPLEALRRLGGREFAAIAGAIVAARTERVPVILDGFAAIVAAVVLDAAMPGAAAHCAVADAGSGAQARAANHLGLRIMLDMRLSSGDGTAAALAAGILRGAALIHDQTVPLPT